MLRSPPCRHGAGVTPGLRTDCFLVVLGGKKKNNKNKSFTRLSERRAHNQSKPKSRAEGSPLNARTVPCGNLMGTSRPPPRQTGEQRGQGSTRSRRGGIRSSGGFWWSRRLPWCQFIDAEDAFSEGKQLPRGSRGSSCISAAGRRGRTPRVLAARSWSIPCDNPSCCRPGQTHQKSASCSTTTTTTTTCYC